MTLTRPVAGEPLLGDGAGTRSTVILDEAFDLVDAHEAALVGPVFVSPLAKTAVASETMLDATTSLTVPNTWFTTNATGLTTVGSAPSIWAVLKNGSQNNASLTANIGVNLASDQSVGTHSHIALSWAQQIGSENLTSSPISDDANALYNMEVVISDVPAVSGVFSGNIVTASLGVLSANSVYTRLYIPIQGLTKIRSVGIRSKRAAMASPLSTNRIYIRQIAWATQSELEVAEGGNGSAAVFISAGYISSVASHVADVGPGKTHIDSRPGHEHISNLNGVAYARQFHIPEDGTDVTAIMTTVLNGLGANSEFHLTHGAKYRMNGGAQVAGLKNVVIEGNGATLYREIRSANFLVFNDNTNVKVRNLNIVCTEPQTTSGSAMTNWSGTPATSGSTKLLSTVNDGVSTGPDFFHRDPDGDIVLDITLSQTGTATNDLILEFAELPPAYSPTNFVVTNGGPMQSGTYMYRMSVIYADGTETGMSPPGRVTLSTYGRVAMTIPTIGVGSGVPIVARRIYRTRLKVTETDSNGYLVENYVPVGTINNNTDTVFHDSNAAGSGFLPTPTFTLTNLGTAGLNPGTYTYLVTTISAINDAEGFVDVGEVPTLYGKAITATGNVRISNLPGTGDPNVAKRRVYRSAGSGSLRQYVFSYLVAEIPNNTDSTFDDNVNVTFDAFHPPLDRAPQRLNQPRVTPGLQKRLTATSTPTTYTVRLKPNELDVLERKYTPVFYKGTNQVNTITVHSVTHYTQQGSYADNAALSVGDRNSYLTFDNVNVEGHCGDHTTVTGDSRRTTLVDCDSICVGRQGFSLVGTARDVDFIRCKIIGAGRSAVDIEPYSFITDSNHKFRFIDCEWRSYTNTGLNMSQYANGTELINCRVRGAGTFLGAGGNELKIINLIAPWTSNTVAGRNLFIDGMECAVLNVPYAASGSGDGLQTYSGGGFITGIKLNPTYWADQPLNVTAPGVTVGTVSFARINEATFADTGLAPEFSSANNLADYQSGPFNLDIPASLGGGLNKAMMIDYGVWGKHWPNTYPPTSVYAGQLHFPLGQNMLQRPTVNSRGISSTTVKPNNLRLSSAVTAGATSVTIPFPTRTYPNITSVTATAAVRTGATLAAASYYYRVAARPSIGGPVLALAQIGPTVISGSNNAVFLTVSGLSASSDFIEGLTIYRGTVSNTYNTRFDIIPTRDAFNFGIRASGSTRDFVDLGTTASTVGGTSGNPTSYGYSDPYSVTPTTNFVGTASLSGSNWLPVNETGYEADTNYTVTADTSWPTTVGVTKTVADITLAFGTAAPGAETVTCMIGR